MGLADFTSLLHESWVTINRFFSHKKRWIRMTSLKGCNSPTRLHHYLMLALGSSLPLSNKGLAFAKERTRRRSLLSGHEFRKTLVVLLFRIPIKPQSYQHPLSLSKLNGVEEVEWSNFMSASQIVNFPFGSSDSRSPEFYLSGHWPWVKVTYRQGPSAFNLTLWDNFFICSRLVLKRVGRYE